MKKKKKEEGRKKRQRKMRGSGIEGERGEENSLFF
jgi:hypothetical protein